MEQTTEQGNIPVLFLLKTLLFSYILTGVMLALLAFLQALWRGRSSGTEGFCGGF